MLSISPYSHVFGFMVFLSVLQPRGNHQREWCVASIIFIAAAAGHRRAVGVSKVAAVLSEHIGPALAPANWGCEVHFPISLEDSS